jgi:SAM-dependent methyltransferase
VSEFPADPEGLRASPLLNSWWYYGVELLPGITTQGQYPGSIPMLPRLLMRRCRLRGASCLDIGTMEGLMAVLMARGGASRVLAIDGVDHCLEKLAAVRHYHRVSFDYRTVGPMYGLSDKLEGEGFDLINCSGLLYHVLSPASVLCGLRAAVKRNGLMIVSTNVVVDERPFAEFNAGGALQEEPNTFWYLSTGLLDYLLRYLRLAPLECIYTPHDAMETDWRVSTGLRSGYAAVLCRAHDRELPAADDAWMSDSATRSWEYEWLCDWERAAAQPLSRIGTRRSWLRREPERIELTKAIEAGEPVLRAGSAADSHTLGLGDRS